MSTPRLPAPRTHQTPLTTDSSNTKHSPSESWCTGEDSNLRSSQGAADLQSAAINHSATCAHSTTPTSAKEALVGDPSSTEHGLRSDRCLRAGCRGPESPVPAIKERDAKRVAPRTRQNSATAARSYFRASYDWEAAAGISSLGELRVSFGLLLVRPAARSRLRLWSWRRDLNPRPSDYKSDALPAELRQLAWCDLRRKRSEPGIIFPASRDKQ